MKLSPDNYYCILDSDTSTMHTGTNYKACLPDNKKRRKHLLEVGIRGQSTPEGQWIPTEIKDFTDINNAFKRKERKMVMWAFILIVFAIILAQAIKLQ